MARELDALSALSGRSNPLDNTREPAMGRLVPFAVTAAVVLAALGWSVHVRTEHSRIRAVATAVAASGHPGPVKVEPLRGDECWRAREGFAWRTADASGFACAGPGDEVRLQDHIAGMPEGAR